MGQRRWKILSALCQRFWWTGWAPWFPQSKAVQQSTLFLLFIWFFWFIWFICITVLLFIFFCFSSPLRCMENLQGGSVGYEWRACRRPCKVNAKVLPWCQGERSYTRALPKDFQGNCWLDLTGPKQSWCCCPSALSTSERDLKRNECVECVDLHVWALTCWIWRGLQCRLVISEARKRAGLQCVSYPQPPRTTGISTLTKSSATLAGTDLKILT